MNASSMFLTEPDAERLLRVLGAEQAEVRTKLNKRRLSEADGEKKKKNGSLS